MNYQLYFIHIGVNERYKFKFIKWKINREEILVFIHLIATVLKMV